MPGGFPRRFRRPFLGQGLGERGERQRARRVPLEGPHDERRLLIGFEHRLTAAPGTVATDVPVAEGCSGGPATLRRLLVQALADLLAEVGRVELRDRGEDPLHQLPGCRVLQALGDRVQPHAGLPERGPNRGVVLEVPGEAIELVDHEAVDAGVLPEARQHGLELWPVGGTSRLPAVDVFVGELPALVADEPAARLGLGRD